jgi:Mn-dependent DtxR family transcriptional regulator
VARAVEKGTSEPVPVGAIAASLSVAPASVNEKIKKLADRGLLDYEPHLGESPQRSDGVPGDEPTSS